MHATTSQLIAVRDGEPVAAAVRDHVADCPSCRAAVDKLAGLARSLRTLPDLEPPADAFTRIQKRMAQKQARRRPGFWPTALAAGLAGALAVGIWLGHDGGETDTRTQQRIAAMQSEAAWLEALNREYQSAGQPMPLSSEATLNALSRQLDSVDRSLAEAESPSRRLSLLERRVTLLEASVTLQAAEDGGIRLADSTL